MMISLRILLFTILCSWIKCVYIKENGYRDITISFSANVIKDPRFDFLKLKEILRNASDILFHATKNRSYFEDFLLVVPSTWTQKEGGVCDEFVEKAPKNIDMYFTDSSDISVITTRHSKGCGKGGEIVYLPKEWMTGNTQKLALEFIQQWSIFRYGVFSENPERLGSCIASADLKWSPAGCYNIELNEEVTFDENGLPSCRLPNDFKERDLHSSIMFSFSGSSKMQHFCDESESFPHNSVAPTLHNRMCDGNAVWSVIENSEDFKYGRNYPRKDTNPRKKTTFRCFKESKAHLTLMIQDTDSEARSEIRYALFYFLSIIEPGNFAVSLATFSSSTNTIDNDFINIKLEGNENLKSLLDSRVKLNEEMADVCLKCGLRKAYKVSGSSQYSLRTIVLIARESSLENIKDSEITEIIQDANAVLHILFLEDTASDIIPTSLVEAVQNIGGRIFRLKNEPVLMISELTTALLDASKNILHIEDNILVVHKKTYENVTTDINDVFLTPKSTKGKLLYSMQFKKRGDIRNVDETCQDKDADLQSPTCGRESEISDDEESAQIWRYSFRYMAGSKGTTCSSLALLKLQSPSKNSFTVKGWLSENKITPGQNALVIYAEVYNRLNHDVKVEARISGPGLEDFRLDLRDNGNGDPDIIKGDNIYSRYFTSFSQKGTYTVSIVVQAMEPRNNTKVNSTDNELKVSQTKVIGTFRVVQTPPEEDVLPPNRVCDLKVISINSTNRTVLLQWTAPGDNYDYGNATKYTIKLSNNWIALKDFAFHLKENILLETEEHQPGNSGEPESLTVQCISCNNNSTYYIALQASDNNYNKGRVSNIVQIHFINANFSSIDEEEISTEPSKVTNTAISLDLTKATTETITSTGFTTIEQNITVVPENQTNSGFFIERNIFIITVSSLGAFILVLIILNIVVCYCCYKKQHSDKPKKVSKKASLRPPHNLNVAYKHGSESSLNDDQIVSNSLSTLVDHSVLDSSSDGRDPMGKRYSYHTDRSLKNKMESPNKRSELGFKLVQPMPAYATSSLSRFVAQQNDMDNEVMQHAKLNTDQLAESNTDDTHIYSLGQV